MPNHFNYFASGNSIWTVKYGQSKYAAPGTFPFFILRTRPKAAIFSRPLPHSFHHVMQRYNDDSKIANGARIWYQMKTTCQRYFRFDGRWCKRSKIGEPSLEINAHANQNYFVRILSTIGLNKKALITCPPRPRPLSLGCHPHDKGGPNRYGANMVNKGLTAADVLETPAGAAFPSN